MSINMAASGRKVEPGDGNEFPKPGDENSATSSTEDIFGKVVPIHKQLSDVGQFSYAALCATALHTQFEGENDSKFREEALAVILISLEQPQQVCESVRAMLQGHGQDDMDPFIDILLAEEVLQKGAESIVSQLLAIAIGKGSYDARMRVVIKHLAWRLRVSWDAVEEIESEMSETLAMAQYEMSEMEREQKQEKKKKEKQRKLKRYALIGLATVGGGTLIGLTGGLAAPLVAAGAGAIIGGAGAAVLGTTAGVALIGSLFGVAGAGLTGYKMKKRVGAIEEFEFEPLVCGNTLRVDSLATKQLHITIAVTGWLSNQMKDFRRPWKHLASSPEQYVLRWETKYLVPLGEAMDYIFNSAMAMATQEALKYTVLNGILAAIAWPAALVSASNIIDNPWSVALQRAQAAGRMLAEVLLSREQGNRPVTLIGYSLGARVIFSCLEELCKRKCSEGIVEDVVMLGTPATGDPKVWAMFSKVVAGKIVNGFCRGDWLLKFLYRTSSVQLSIAGLRPIRWADRRMHNIDLSDVVNGHMDYKEQLDTIMKAVGVKTRDEVTRMASGSKLTDSDKTSSEASAAMDELSSSDEEAFDQGKIARPAVSKAPATGPVILEDYSSQDTRADAVDREVDNKGSLQQFVIPGSASFDSGVDINRAESGSRERLTTQDSVDRVVSPEVQSDSGDKVEGADGRSAVSAEGVSEKRPEPRGDKEEGSSGTSTSQSLTQAPKDRVGDAGANGGDSTSDGSDQPHLEPPISQAEDTESKVEELTGSTLQRKKMFDSMYRLVLDDDLLDDFGDEDDDDDVVDGGASGNLGS
ncbi:transmembrane and coiled-coil domain-containing protein 4 isoform X2 [Aplysia californica]|uniref:Transmembrane and coiled-coil domain-containing protein 4 isoform X2 n=1 Tax=Aplysia californica TaxID=6500 RepID=A0ABM1A604_APLCA|nr:transmembrane and coiled-coil domain-containing protein 4 isoform X2 [Aplysia californica]